MKHLLALSLFVIAFISANAQEFTVPDISDFKNEADYAKYEKDVIACANWLENNPLNQDRDKRAKANSFMIKWISGSPNVSIGIDETVTNLADKNEQLLVLFMSGWTRYALENNYSKDNNKGYF